MARRDAKAGCDSACGLPAARKDARVHAPLMRALADEARLDIVARLAAAGGPVCVCDLIPGLGLAQPTVSHHLRTLRDAGVVTSERRGSWVYYSLDFSVVGRLADLISALAPPSAATRATESAATEPPTRAAS
ncbi:MAG: helix-turn-helix transcriptional regulator [Deltaproteobacteria bacterium]|nr:helix-turn-helix transcriptional regulator [Deltaproteobacteria bacterium]